MESVFPIVVFGAVALSVVMSVIFLLGRGSVYDQIGQGGLTGDEDASAQAPAVSFESPAGRAERETEIRQMLSARSARLVGRGEAALDIDAEVRRLLGPAEAEEERPGGAHDAGLTDEVRQLVVARNERRRRRGLEPLDVEAETARTLAELDP